MWLTISRAFSHSSHACSLIKVVSVSVDGQCGRVALPLVHGELMTKVLARLQHLAGLFAAVLWISVGALANCPGQPMDGSRVANPNRPTISDPADITQLGVVELEYGYTRTWVGATRDHDLSGLLKFAVLCDLEFRWTPDNFHHAVAGGITQKGAGDNWIGAQYRFHHQTSYTPTIAFRYEAKVPTASASKGFGSGAPDHSFTFMASKDIGKYHFDYNLGYLLAGHPTGHSYDSNSNLALAFSRPIRGPLGITGEGYGETKLDQAPAYASVLLAFTYGVTPQLVVDSGYDVGVTNGSPGNHLFVGFTYAVIDVYSHFRVKQTASNKPDPGRGRP